MWPIFFGFGKIKKMTKMQKWKEAMHLPEFFLSVFKQNWKTVVALCGAIFLDFGKTRETVKVKKWKETIHLLDFFRQFSRKPGKW